MSAFSTLLALINAQIKTNGLKAITGAKLNGVLVQMVNELGSGYQFIDIATPATDPGTPDENVWYIASQAGTYTNFGGIIVNENEVCALVWNGSWTKKVTGAATAAQVSQLGQYANNIETLTTPAHIDFSVVSGQAIANQTYKVFPNVKAGEILTIKYVSSLNIEFSGTYIFYKDGTTTSIYDLATNTMREIHVAKDVEYVSFFLNSPSTSGNVSLYCGKKNDISTRVATLENSSQETREDIEEEAIKSSHISSRISPNDISFNVVSGTGINNLTYKNYVDVKAGETLAILYSSALSLTFVATYVYYKDGTSTSIGDIATNVLKEYVVAKDVNFVSFYLAPPTSSGVVTLSCWEKDTIDSNIQILDSAIFDVESSFKVTSGEAVPQNKYRLYAGVRAGEKVAVYIKDATVATIDGIYVKYVGESSLQAIGTSVARYTYNTFTAQKDIEYITFAINSPASNGYVVLNLTLLDSVLPQIQKLQSRVGEIKKTIPLVSGTGISALKYWLFPDIKSGQTMRLYAETNDIAGIDVVYVKYASNSSLTSLGALSANTEKFIVATDDIEYISFYIASPSSNGSVIFSISRADTLNSVLRLNEQIPIIQKKKVSLSLSSTDKLMLYGDSISSDSYPWYADWIKQFTGLTNVYAGGFPGYNVSQLASATCLQRVFDYAPNVIIIMVGANDIGDIVGTFGDLPGQEIVEDVDISEAYSGTYFIQAVSYILQKIRSYYYDIITRSGLTTPIDMQDTTSVETIDDVLLPYIAVCTPMPENLYGPGPGYEKFNSRKNQLNRRNAVVECCNKHKFHCIDFFNLVDIDWSQEPYFNTPTDTRYSNGIYTMDGLHPNKWGAKKMAEIMLGEVDIKVV